MFPPCVLHCLSLISTGPEIISLFFWCQYTTEEVWVSDWGEGRHVYGTNFIDSRSQVSFFVMSYQCESFIIPLKGDCPDSPWRDLPRGWYLVRKLENGSLGKEIGMIFNKETAGTGHIHVCSSGIVPCDDPEDQMVVSIGREGLLFTGDTSCELDRSHRSVECFQL
jgi:hypothetical protein